MITVEGDPTLSPQDRVLVCSCNVAHQANPHVVWCKEKAESWRVSHDVTGHLYTVSPVCSAHVHPKANAKKAQIWGIQIVTAQAARSLATIAR